MCVCVFLFIPKYTKQISVWTSHQKDKEKSVWT